MASLLFATIMQAILDIVLLSLLSTPLATSLTLRYGAQPILTQHATNGFSKLQRLVHSRSGGLSDRLPIEFMQRFVHSMSGGNKQKQFTTAAIARLLELASQKDGPVGAARIAPDVDFESRLTLCKLVQLRGFGCEEHFVTTDDGFILGVFHLTPAGWKRSSSDLPNSRPAVLMMHGLLDCSFTWVNNFANQSLAFMLVTAGYDVWLGNVRGNTYSRNHTHLRPNQKEFWWWTFDEFARYDLNATTAYVLKQTGQQQLSYVGHSQGTTIMFAALSTYPDIASRVRLFAALGPVARVGHIGGIYKYISMSLVTDLLKTFEVISTGEILPNNKLTTLLAREYCGENAEFADFCVAIIEALNGFGETCNSTRVPVYVSHTPAGSSVSM